MSKEQLKAFLEKVKGDTTLQEKLKAASDADAVVEIAKAAGFSISIDDWSKAQSEVSDEELEGIAGGTLPWQPSAQGQTCPNLLPTPNFPPNFPVTEHPCL